MRYAVVIEKAIGNYSAYVPDLPGCIATGATIEAVENEIRDAIRFTYLPRASVLRLVRVRYGAEDPAGRPQSRQNGSYAG